MCDACCNKSEELAELSRFFRENARATRIEYYAALMNETADSLDDLSHYFGERCRCGEPVDGYETLIRPPSGRLMLARPPLSDIA